MFLKPRLMKRQNIEIEFDLNDNQGKTPISLKESGTFCFIAAIGFLALSIIGSIIEHAFLKTT